MIQKEQEIIISLDLGSSNVKAVIGRMINDFEIEILGVGIFPSSGIKNGSIVNIESTTRSIVEAIGEAELMSGIEIETTLVNISGKNIHADNSKGVVAITNREKTVTEQDLYRVIEAAQSIRIPADQEILHVLSKEFSVDDQKNIKDPIGMTGVRLEAEVHIVTAGKMNIHNIDKCGEIAGINIENKILSSLGSAEALLTTGEKNLGVVVVDIGSGVCDVIVYVDGGVTSSSILPLGSSHITQDISIGLKTNIETAEMIKKTHGCVLSNDLDPTEVIDIPIVSGRNSKKILKQELNSIIEPRIREILELVNTDLDKSGVKRFLGGGVILTGGGSLLEGIEILAEDIFNLPVTKAKPAGVSGLSEKVSSPEFSTAVGIIRYASRMMVRDEYQSNVSVQSWTKKITKWIKENI